MELPAPKVELLFQLVFAHIESSTEIQFNESLSLHLKKVKFELLPFLKSRFKRLLFEQYK